MFSIYKITNKINNKVYIGFASNVKNRIKIHKSSSKKEDSKFYRAVRKYGWDNFEYTVIYESSDRDYTLKVMEPKFIKEHDSYLNGYNSTLGGDGCFGMVLSDKSRKQISDKNKIPKPQTKEHSAKISTSLKEYHKNNKVVFSQEHKQKLSLSNKGKLKGIKKSKEHIEKMKLRWQDNTTLICSHCNKQGDYKNMKRWHMDKCKLRPQ